MTAPHSAEIVEMRGATRRTVAAITEFGIAFEALTRKAVRERDLRHLSRSLAEMKQRRAGASVGCPEGDCGECDSCAEIAAEDHAIRQEEARG